MPPFDFSVPAQGDALVRTVIGRAGRGGLRRSARPGPGGQVGRRQSHHRAARGRTLRLRLGPRPGRRSLELEPDKVARLLVATTGQPGHPGALGPRSSRGSTYLTLVHSGFDDDALAEEFRQGWPGFLVEIKRILELGYCWQPIKI